MGLPTSTTLRRGRFTHLLASLLAVGIASFVWYFYFQPWLFLERVHWATRDSMSPEFGRSIRAAAALGPRALPQVLGRIGRGVKETGALYSVLREMGEPARAALVSAIDHERDPWKRQEYVEALVYAFDDYSRFNLWIERLEADPHLASPMLWMDLMLQFGDAVPPITEERTLINPAFLRWYDARTVPKGPFPPRRVSGTPSVSSDIPTNGPPLSRHPVTGRALSRTVAWSALAAVASVKARSVREVRP